MNANDAPCLESAAAAVSEIVWHGRIMQHSQILLWTKPTDLAQLHQGFSLGMEWEGLAETQSLQLLLDVRIAALRPQLLSEGHCQQNFSCQKLHKIINMTMNAVAAGSSGCTHLAAPEARSSCGVLCGHRRPSTPTHDLMPPAPPPLMLHYTDYATAGMAGQGLNRDEFRKAQGLYRSCAF